MRIFAALAAVCAISLTFNCFFLWKISTYEREIDHLLASINALQAVRRADDISHQLRDTLHQEAHSNARKKYEVLENIPDDLSDPDWLDAVRYGLRPKGGNSGADTAGKHAHGLPAPGNPGRNDANP